ncbi:MAG: DUF547 domain-containing protein [Micropepsaceae bacterium]
MANLLSRRTTIASMFGVVGLAFTTMASAAELDDYFKANNPASTVVIDHNAWSAFLGKYIVRSQDGINRVTYAKVAIADKQSLKQYIRNLQTVKVTSLKSDEQRAFWANLYNAVTIDVVLSHFPVKSIKDISLGGSLFASGPWSKPLVTVEGKQLSLDNIEHDILRKVWHDPRVHYSVNCASIGCPNLMPVAFTGASLDTLLTQGAHDYINHPRGVRVAGTTVQLSKIYSWFVVDFGTNQAQLLSHLKKYAEPALKAQLDRVQSISGYDYDWSINEAR